MKIGILGQGYVGLNVSVSAASAGIETIGFDTNQSLVKSLLSGLSHIPDIKSSDLKSLIKNKSIGFSSDMTLLQDCDSIIIAVPTPINDQHLPDLKYLKEASESIYKYAQDGALIINESTSYPGTLRDFIRPITDPNLSRKFLYASAPERIDPGNPKWNLSNTPRIIAGLNSEATDKTKILYSKFCGDIFIATSPEAAEAAKIFENTFRQVNIALVNEFSNILYHLGLTASETLKAASTKPFGLMPFIPSIGVGGHCIPVDPYYLTYALKKLGVSAPLIEMANSINLSQPREIAIRISNLFGGDLNDKKIQIAGITYKSDTPDLRESPAIKLIEELTNLGAIVTWFDPLITEFQGTGSTPLKADIDLGLIVSPHKGFNFDIWKKSEIKVLDLSASHNEFGWEKFL